MQHLSFTKQKGPQQQQQQPKIVPEVVLLSCSSCDKQSPMQSFSWRMFWRMLFGRLKPCVCFISFSLQIWNHHSLHRMKWKQYETVSQIIPAVQSCHSFKLQLPLCNLVCQVQRLSIGPSRLAKQTTEKRRKTEKEEKKGKKNHQRNRCGSLYVAFCHGLFWAVSGFVQAIPRPARKKAGPLNPGFIRFIIGFIIGFIRFPWSSSGTCHRCLSLLHLK